MPSNHVTRLPAVLNGRLLEIPDYQRPFAWSEKQLKDLWEDLDLLGPHGTHYAGTLVLREVRTTTGEERTSLADDGATLTHCEVVDGQQRLTTCLLLMDRIRRRLEVLAGRDVPNAGTIASRLRGDYGVLSVDSALRPRLRLGQDLNDYWMDISLGDKHYVGSSLIAGQARLRDAASFFDSGLEGYSGEGDATELERLKDLQRRVSAGLGFLVYEVESAAEVGMIFETLNERGRPLSDLEKAKNYLLYLARTLPDGRSEVLAELINKSWADIFRNLANQGRDADDQLLRAHWLATQDPDRREWKQIASLKKRFDRSQYISGETRVVPVTKESQDQESAWNGLVEDVTTYVRSLRDCSFFLAEMFNPHAVFEAFASHQDDARRRSGALARSGVVAPYRPLLFTARLRHPKDGAFYSRLVDLCERYSARVFVIEQRRLNAGEARLLRLAYELYLGADQEDTLRELAAVLWRYASDAELETTLQSTAENWYARRGHKYFLYEYELSVKAHGQELEPLSEFTAASKEQRTTEHVLPRHPDPEGSCWWDHFTEDEHAALVHSLGNLALTYDNSSYGRKCFIDKRGLPLGPGVEVATCYAQAGLKQEQLLAQYEVWTPSTIYERQQELAAWALKRWKVMPPTSTELATEEPDIEAEDPEGLDADPSA